ncbi:MAG: hypothetical protein H8D84_00235 [Proteobacteria bacterium]|jgi:hypothetical protein|nr:hypothetical protein [Pseudomonadota bacterium]
MQLREFFNYTQDGFEQDKTYDPEQDISILDKDDTRKTRLTLSDINSMRLASEDHDDQQKEEAEFVQKMYAQPQADDLAI